MYAIIEVGAKQYNVEKGDIIEVEKFDGKKDKEFALNKILLVVKDDKIEVGKPYLKEAKVLAEFLNETKAKKVISFKYRRRKASHWKKGHRQKLCVIKITDIKLGS